MDVTEIVPVQINPNAAKRFHVNAVLLLFQKSLRVHTVLVCRILWNVRRSVNERSLNGIFSYIGLTELEGALIFHKPIKYLILKCVS